MNTNFNLDASLIEFTDKSGTSSFSTREAVEGVQIFGGIGSGKTSGSGRMLALKYLQHNFGGLVLTVKPDEKEMWQDYCRQTNRLDDLVIIEPGGQQYFNFMEYESIHACKDQSITENLVQVLKTVIRASEEKSGGKTDDPFWETAQDMLIYNTIDLIKLAYGSVSVQVMYDIVLSAPKKSTASSTDEEESNRKNAFDQAFTAAQKFVLSRIDAWEASLLPDTLDQIERNGNFEWEILQAVPESRILKSVDQFFLEHFRNLSEKTRSIVEFSFSGFLFRLLKDPVYSLFCNKPSTVLPDDCLEGKIILLNLPVKLYHKVGRDSQIMFKYIWQRAMEKRNVHHNNRPVFLWADEAQNFLHEYDAEYQATARSSRIATVYISQNLPNYHASMGGLKSEYKVKSFLGTLATKIFHANADIETNKYASELIGEAYTEDVSRTATAAGSFSSSSTKSYKLEKMVRPEEITGLKTGGPVLNFIVEGYMHRQGRTFPNGLSFRKVSFKQQS